MSDAIGRREISFLRALEQKKYRDESGQFLIEGVKLVASALSAGFPVKSLIATAKMSENIPPEIAMFLKKNTVPIAIVSAKDMERISAMKSPEGILAVGLIPDNRLEKTAVAPVPAIYLWEVNDPGNLGTIFRTALWFGVRNILLSPGSVDPYNPKAVRGSMGALFGLNIFTEVDLPALSEIVEKTGARLLAADMSGAPPQGKTIGENWLMAFGSESHGLPDKILQKADSVFAIRKRGDGESLNLAISVGIMLNEILQEQELNIL
ncbi:MAG: RNA methyltransferase [Candidatus Neomarinimicrobiota bacterium]